MRYTIPVSFIAAFLLLIAGAYAAAPTDITLDSPRDGQNVTNNARFSFTVTSGEVIDTCALLMDGEAVKTARYDNVLRGRTLSFAMLGDDGPHNWTLTCSTPSGNITPAAVSFILDNPQSPVKVVASGTIRGSMVHTFKMKNEGLQPPVVVPKVATGDFVEISLNVPPSTIKKEFYVRQRTVRNDTPTLWLTHKQEDFYLTQGENTTLNLTQSARVIANFEGIVNNRATIVFYPTGKTVVAEEPTETTETPATETPETAPAPETTETPTNGTAETTTDSASDAPAAQPETDDAPKQGGFKRFLSWLTSIFG